MEETPVINQPVGAAEAPTVQPGTDTPRMIPFPDSKLRALNQELSDLRKQVRAQTPSTNPAYETLEPTAKQALSMIGSQVRSDMAPELEEIRGGLEEAKFDRAVEELRQDKTASRYATEIVEEMEKIARKNPSLSRSDMLEQAKREAIYSAVMSGRYQSSATEQAAEEILGDRSRFASTPQRSAAQTGRGSEELSLEDMSTEQIAADPSKFNALFEQTQGRKPRR